MTDLKLVESLCSYTIRRHINVLRASTGLAIAEAARKHHVNRSGLYRAIDVLRQLNMYPEDCNAIPSIPPISISFEI